MSIIKYYLSIYIYIIMVVKRSHNVQRKRVHKRGSSKSKRKNMKRKSTLKKKKRSTLKKKRKSKKRGGERQYYSYSARPIYLDLSREMPLDQMRG